MSPITLRSGVATDTGRVRSANEDAALVSDTLFAVADGMGGHAAGEVASRVALEALQSYAEATTDGMVRAVRLANRAVWARADDEPELRGMGTTLCAVAIIPGSEPDGEHDELGDGDRLIVLNVGDSRVYRMHDGELDQLTDDHSLVEDLVREGRLSADEAKVHPQRNILTRVLGNERDVDVDWWEVTPYTGDRYLLCSDGLFNEVDDERTASVLRRLADPEEAARELVRLANEAGGRDNITVVVVDVVDDGGVSEAASAAIAGEESATSSRDEAAPAVDDEVDADDDPVRLEPHDAVDETRPASAGAAGRPRRVTWRAVVFVAAVLAVLVAAGGATAWYARSTYFVGLDDDDVVIYQGRPGGFLWIDPTLKERTGLTLAEVPPARRADVRAGKDEPSLAAARRYVANLEDEGAARRRMRATTTTTSASTTTTSSPTVTTARTGTTP